MASVIIKTENDQTKFAPKAQVVLTAKSDVSATGYQWKQGDVEISGATKSEYRFAMSADTEGAYTVVVDVGGQKVSATPVTISMKDAANPPQVASPAVPTPAEPQPVFDSDFAITTAAVVFAIILWLFATLRLGDSQGGFTATDWTALEGRLQVGVRLTLPLVALGTITLLIGLWMAVVEWRGRFQPQTKAPAATKGFGGEDAGKIIAAVGQLRGAALAMVTGALLLISAAWVAQSAAGAPSQSTTSVSDSTATGSDSTTAHADTTKADTGNKPTPSGKSQ